MARPSYKSEKRKKELQRQKKQEEKRQKRLNKTPGQEAGIADAATLEGLGIVVPQADQADAEETAQDETGDEEDSPGNSEQ